MFLSQDEEWSFLSNLSTNERFDNSAIQHKTKNKKDPNQTDIELNPSKVGSRFNKKENINSKKEFTEDNYNEKSNLYKYASDYEMDERFNFSKKQKKEKTKVEKSDELYFTI